MSSVHELGWESRNRMDREEPLTLLLIGKTGNGKSSVANTILGRKAFPTGRSMASTTVTTQEESVWRNGYRVKVVDTPDVVKLDMDMAHEVQKWRNSQPFAVILVVRCDVRYTPEEYNIYQKFLQQWGVSVTNRLIVVFTFGDRQDRDIEQELQTVNWELKNVLKDAGGRYVVFDNTADDSRKDKMVNDLLRLVQRQREDEKPFFNSIVETVFSEIDKMINNLLRLVLLLTGVGFIAGVATHSKPVMAVFGIGFLGTLALAIKYCTWRRAWL